MWGTLQALFGEMRHTKGEFGLAASYRDDSGRALPLGYVPQSPWIQNLSLRENILVRHHDRLICKAKRGKRRGRGHGDIHESMEGREAISPATMHML